MVTTNPQIALNLDLLGLGPKPREYRKWRLNRLNYHLFLSREHISRNLGWGAQQDSNPGTWIWGAGVISCCAKQLCLARRRCILWPSFHWPASFSWSITCVVVFLFIWHLLKLLWNYYHCLMSRLWTYQIHSSHINEWNSVAKENVAYKDFSPKMCYFSFSMN